MLRVVGVGLGRTGTHSLKLALEELLGGPCYHMLEVFEHLEHAPVWHDAAIEAYERHNAAVRAEVPPDRLVEWRPDDGWAPICSALDLPVPDRPFPHVNTTAEFRELTGLDAPST